MSIVHGNARLTVEPSKKALITERISLVDDEYNPIMRFWRQTDRVTDPDMVGFESVFKKGRIWIICVVGPDPKFCVKALATKSVQY